MVKRKLRALKESDVNSHYRAVKYIAQITGKDYDYVNNILNAFFGKWGLKYFIHRRKIINIRMFGKFYYHSNTIKKFKNRNKKVSYLD